VDAAFAHLEFDLGGLFRGEPAIADLLSGGSVIVDAVGADLADEALGHHQRERRAHQIRLDTYIDETGDGGGSVVGVEGGKHEVTGEREFDRNVGSLFVADFTDEHDVRVLTQHGTES